MNQEFLEVEKFSGEVRGRLCPQSSQNNDPFLQPCHPIAWVDAEGLVLAVEIGAKFARTDAGREHRAPLRHVVEGGPLRRQQDGITQWKTCHACHPKLHATRPRRNCREKHDRFEPRPCKQVVADEDGVEAFRRFRKLGHIK